MCFCMMRNRKFRKCGCRGALISAALFLVCLPLFCSGFAASAAAQTLFKGGETRALKIYFVHTNEREEVVFKKNGRYIRSGLKRLNHLTRDWRRNEAANMDPRLFDLVWQIYQLSGSQTYIHVVSGYRSPQTNTMLRLSSPASGVAKHSRHMEGKAMDFYLPDVNLAYLRAIALKLQGGGIGYYPNSGSPFVHVDVGNVRHWPRMSARALAALFPDGKSLHVPANGRPPAAYMLALAEYRQRGAAPVAVASARQLFAGLSKRQVILAAADGHLPHLRGSRAADMRGMGGAGAWPPQAAPAESPLMAQAAKPPAIFGGFIPIPSAAPLMPAEFAEAAEDEADIAAAPVPVPQFKDRALPQGRQTGSSEIDGLLAYAPMPLGPSAGSAALAAISAAEFVPVPGVKPAAAETVSGGALAQILPKMKPKRAERDSVSALIAQNAAVPLPHLKQRPKAAARRK